MNHYYATGAHIFEGPPTRHGEPSYGSVGHFTSHLSKYEIKAEYKTNEKSRSQIDIKLTAPDGEKLFIPAEKHEEMRDFVYKWAKIHGTFKRGSDG